MLDPGAGSDPGGGTSTLVVTGTARADNLRSNGSVYQDFDTTFSVRITLGGVPVTTGTVTVKSTSASVPLTFNPDGQGNGNGRWQGTQPGYDEVFVLDITSGTDTVTGVRVDGPDIHTFTAPTIGASVNSLNPMDVSWSRDDVADTTTLRTERIDSLAIADAGTYALPAGSLKSSKDRAEPNTLRITRSNRVTPAGAAAGSEWAVSITNTIDVLVQPAP